jgi:hypothetical protein
MVLPLLLAGATLHLEQFLDSVPRCIANEARVLSRILDAAISDDALVVRMLE